MGSDPYPIATVFTTAFCGSKGRDEACDPIILEFRCYLESTCLVHELHSLCRSNEAGRRGWRSLAKGVICYEKTRHSSIIMYNIEGQYCGMMVMMLSSAFPFLAVMIRHDIDITWYES